MLGFAYASKASSPLFMLLTLGGSIVLYSSVFTFLPNVVTDVTCALQPWFLTIGFTLLFVYGQFQRCSLTNVDRPIFAKTWRIHQLWREKKYKGLRHLVSDGIIMGSRSPPRPSCRTHRSCTFFFTVRHIGLPY